MAQPTIGFLVGNAAFRRKPAEEVLAQSGRRLWSCWGDDYRGVVRRGPGSV